MHILINGWFWGDETSGSGQYLHYLTVHLSRQLRDANDKITLVVPQISVESNRHSDSTDLPNHVDLRTASLPNLPRQLVKVWWEQITIPSMARKEEADVLWVPYWAAPLWQPIPTTVTIHDIIPYLLPAYRGGRLQRLYTKLVSASARKAATIITVSEASRRDVITHLHIAPSKVHAVLSGPNDSVLSNSALSSSSISDSSFGDSSTSDSAMSRRTGTESPSSAYVRKKYALPEQYFLYLGGFDVRKNVVTVVKAYQAYLAQGGDPNVKLVIAGRLPKEVSDFFPNVASVVQELELKDVVRFCGFVDEADKPMLYQLSVGYLFPSVYEGFGMTVIEAMNAGTPVITSSEPKRI